MKVYLHQHTSQMCQTFLSFGHITLTLHDNTLEFTKEKLAELINCTAIKSKYSAFSAAQFLVRNSWVIKHPQTLCLKLSCLFGQLIIVDYEFSILLQSKTRHMLLFVFLALQPIVVVFSQPGSVL